MDNMLSCMLFVCARWHVVHAQASNANKACTTCHLAQTCMLVVVPDGMSSLRKASYVVQGGMLTTCLSSCIDNMSFVQDAMLSMHKASNVTCYLARTTHMHVDMSCAMGHSV